MGLDIGLSGRLLFLFLVSLLVWLVANLCILLLLFLLLFTRGILITIGVIRYIIALYISDLSPGLVPHTSSTRMATTPVKPGDTSPAAENKPTPQPTLAEAYFFLNIIKYVKTKLEVDWDKVAEESGFKNAETAKVCIISLHYISSRHISLMPEKG